MKKYLWFLTLSYAMALIFADWFDPRLVKIFGLVTDAGTLIFPFTYLLSDLITEVYGYKNARMAIWVGFLFNAIFLLYGQIVIHLPSPDFANHNQQFDLLLGMDMRVIIASIISYFSAEPFNSYILAKLKIKLKGRAMAFRFVTSTFIAALIDSFIFGFIAFYGIINNKNLLNLILTMWFFKVIIEIIGLPISIRLAKKLKRIENTDIYDNNTNFNLFSLDTKYPS